MGKLKNAFSLSPYFLGNGRERLAKKRQTFVHLRTKFCLLSSY